MDLPPRKPTLYILRAPGLVCLLAPVFVCVCVQLCVLCGNDYLDNIPNRAIMKVHKGLNEHRSGLEVCAECGCGLVFVCKVWAWACGFVRGMGVGVALCRVWARASAPEWECHAAGCEWV